MNEQRQQAYFQLLMELQQATIESRGDVQVVYPLLSKNTDKLDGVLPEILRQWGTNTLGEAKADEAKSLAAVIVLFSKRISEFPLGNKASNMEIAITGYEVALTVYTQQAFPQDWAMTQNNLSVAYLERIRGERAENLEQAITCCHSALKVYTFDAFLYEWAATQNNLGKAFRMRIRGERAENLEQAIACCHSALKVRTYDAFSYEWATTQNNLGEAYLYKIRGERAENLELAITACQEALKVYTFDAFPYEWAATQTNLGEAFRNRIRGERAENLERAIAAYEEALKVYTFDAFPYEWASTKNLLGNVYLERFTGERAENLERAIDAYEEALRVRKFDAFRVDWAMTQMNLASAYIYRIRGDRADNLERALAAYEEALKVYTFEAFPVDWAMTQNNLGEAYRHRIKGERSNNLEMAITAYQKAFIVRTYDAFPYDWAATQNNLGNAYSIRIIGERAENLEQAIAAYQEAVKIYTFNAFPYEWARIQLNIGEAYRNGIRGGGAENLEQAITAYEEALKIYTFDAFPYEWAMTQNNLGNAYTNGMSEDVAKNLEQAIAAYTAALTVRTREAFPQHYAETLVNLGMAYQNANQFTSAYTTFASAIATVQSLREEIVSGEESKRKQAEEWNRLYSRMVEVCIELSNITEAIEYVERSKTRNLVEQILERDSKSIFPPDVVTQLETYRDEITIGQYQIQNGKAENPTVLAKHLQELRQQRNELQNRYLPVGYNFKFDPFHATLDERTAIIEWYLLNDKILAFIIKPRGELTVWQSQPEDREALENWLNQYLQNYYNQKHQWQNNLGKELKKLASILHIDEILTQIPSHCDQVILIPHWFLHLFPLHALPVSQNSVNSRCLLDLFPRGVGYVPSCQLLQQVQMRQRPDFQSLFAIQNPTEDLNYTDLEVQVIQSYFNSNTSNVLKTTAATLTAINNTDLNTYHCAHFSCHGYFNLSNPGKSALILANAPVADAPTKPDSERYLNLRLGETHDLDKCLTLDKIFSLKLEKCRLVTLSACETGLIDFRNTSDEYIGLPSGFLLAGSPSVVSSLWRVNDLSTSFLMIKFYENLAKLYKLEAGDVAIALKNSQKWLRNLTIEELQIFKEEHKPEIKTVLAQLRKGQRKRVKESWKLINQRQPLPFANPYYWAGFTASGL
ncbi:CHAT domain-containing protein [Nostoc sp. CHAB 5836]|uniref:CHAT domain-containing protein n=1 Tax=Nostoc sp. CHAB 5836 TaxID=2780404 RepID=UPI001E62E785|nr:CHAT domain-containing protein [Nostoc sp. CHAB 5836]